MKYNFYNKISCVKFFNCDNDLELQKAILNEFDKLSNMEERQEFTSAIRDAGINIHNLTSTKSYTKHDNEELSYEQAQIKMQEFRNAIEEDEEVTKNLSPYMKNLYDTDKDQFELASIVNEAFDYTEEDHKVIKSQNYYNMMNSFNNRIQERSERHEQERAENRARRKDDRDSKVNIDEIWKNID